MTDKQFLSWLRSWLLFSLVKQQSDLFFFDMTKLFLTILLFLMYSFLNNTAIASQQTWAPVYHILIHPGMIQIQMLRLVFHYVKMWFQIMVLLVVHIKSLSTCFFSSIATISKGCEFSWRGAVKKNLLLQGCMASCKEFGWSSNNEKKRG